MTDKQQRRMRGVPNQIHLVSQDNNHTPEPKSVVKMVRVRDVLIGGFGWALASLVIAIVGAESVDSMDVMSPLLFALGFVFLVDQHDVEV